MASLSASVFRRGGPKRELFDDGDGGGIFNLEDADRQHLHAEIGQLLEVLSKPKTG
jgi:hypothetical protein